MFFTDISPIFICTCVLYPYYYFTAVFDAARVTKQNLVLSVYVGNA